MTIKFHQLIQQPVLKLTEQERLLDFYDVIADAVDNDDVNTEGESTPTTLNELLNVLGLHKAEHDLTMTDWSLKQDDVLQEFINLWADYYHS